MSYPMVMLLCLTLIVPVSLSEVEKDPGQNSQEVITNQHQTKTFGWQDGRSMYPELTYQIDPEKFYIDSDHPGCQQIAGSDGLMSITIFDFTGMSEKKFLASILDKERSLPGSEDHEIVQLPPVTVDTPIGSATQIDIIHMKPDKHFNRTLIIENGGKKIVLNLWQQKKTDTGIKQFNEFLESLSFTN